MTTETSIFISERAVAYATLQPILEHLLVHANDMIDHAALCEFSAEDATPTIHLDLWREYDLHDLPACVNALTIVAEGHWDGGRSYSLQA